MSLYSFFKSKGKNGFGYATTAEQVTSGISLDGKTILITGCNSGLGKETARVLAMRGARIFATARTKENADQVCNEIGHDSIGFACELSDPKSVRECISSVKKETKKIDVIICNAGIMALAKLQQSHGYELQFFTNHIGHFILVNGLLKLLADDGRIVVLSSGAHVMAPESGIDFDNLDGKKSYSPWKAYGQSKMANLLFVKELSRSLERTSKTANAVHPGVISTNIGRHMNPVANFAFSLIAPLGFKSVAQGAATTCYAAVHPELNNVSGKYLADCNIAKSRDDADDVDLAQKLWKKSEEIAAKLK
ncbi:MAG: SDR family oxidoreductase [Spirochaetia bacterium]|nr:SDR family oxidoreductase [Spirochaetia bacterium]